MRKVFMIIISISLVASQHDSNEKPVTHEDVDKEDIKLRVSNGKPATLGQIPYQISLKMPVHGVYISFCGGSLIGTNKVLTAAHCLTVQKNFCEKLCGIYHIKKLERLFAVAGSLRTAGRYTDSPLSTEQWRKLQKAVVPRGYSFPKRDICLVTTATPFVINQYVKPYPVASRNMDYGSMECMASGYGMINERIISDSLLWANLRLIPKYECARIHRKDMRDFICTKSDITDVLQGDSGGGLVCKNTGDPNDKGDGVIVGVVSGAVVESYGYNSFFTRVTSYKKFIQNKTTINTLEFYMTTATPFVINQYVKPYPVASRNMDYGSMECMASGYGMINERIISDSLLWANLRLIPKYECARIHRKDMRDFICTKSDITDVLQGDSGGGLVCKNTGDPNDKGDGVIVGVVSGAVVESYGYNSFFTRVTSYKKFIRNKTTINTPEFYMVWLSIIISSFW